VKLYAFISFLLKASLGVHASGSSEFTPALEDALKKAYRANGKWTLSTLRGVDIPAGEESFKTEKGFAELKDIINIFEQEFQKTLLDYLSPIIASASPVVSSLWDDHGAYTSAGYRAAPRTILTPDEKGFIEAASQAVATIADGTDVHAVNKTILVKHAATIQSYMERLEIPATPETLEEIQKAATTFYEPTSTEWVNINNVLGRINADSASGELGITAYDALWRAHVLAQRCDALRRPGDTTYQSFALKMISQNIEESGGCVDGIVGRAIVVQIKCLYNLLENFQL
jgi:hypothetical protein